MSTEIESGDLCCPECDWSCEIKSGVIDYSPVAGPVYSTNGAITNRVADSIDRILRLRSGEKAFIHASIPNNTLKKWCQDGIEQVQMDTDPANLNDKRAASCAGGHSLIHFLPAPFKPSILRSNTYDAFLVSIPAERILDSHDILEAIPALTKPSGRVLLLFEHGGDIRNDNGKTADLLADSLPETFAGFNSQYYKSKGLDILLLTREVETNSSEWGVAI